MQQESSNQVNQKMILPRRSHRNVGKITRFDNRNFVANYYQVALNPALNTIYLYQAKFPEDIPGDSSQVFIKCILQLRAQLRKSIEYICFSGKIVYGFKKNTISQTFQCKISDSVIEVQIKYNKQLPINCLLDDPKTRPMVFQFLNSSLKSCMRDNNICEMGKIGAFYPKNQLSRTTKNVMSTNQTQERDYDQLERIGLSVLRGYKFTLVMINREINLQLDVCSRVLQSRNLLQDLLDFPGNQQQMLYEFVGKTIITRYGNYKTFTIEDIDFSKNPNSKFKAKQEEITFKYYFRKAYNIEVNEDKQPLLKVKSPMKRQISKKQKVAVIQEEFIYLIPELVSLTGMTDSQRASHQSMKALAPFTKLTPNDRFCQSSKIINLFNNSSDILKVGHEQDMYGYHIPPPNIGLRELTEVRDGSISCRNFLMEPHQFCKWAFIYSVNCENDFSEACVIEQNLKHASKAYGIEYVQPLYIQVKGRNIQDFLSSIDRNLSSYKASEIQICFVILKQKQTTFYGKIKNHLVNKLGIPSQVIQAKSLTRSKNVLSVASKIAIQMSCKAGSAPWVVVNNVPYLNNKNFAYCSISSSKGKGGFTVSFVGTISNQCTQVFSEYAIRMKKKDIIDHGILRTWYVQWIKSYFMANKKKLPDLLILYRESVGESLFKPVINHQISTLKESIQLVRQKTKSKFDPEILYVIVNKKINSRFYEVRRDRYSNPEPGSVIVDSLSTDDNFDFHLAAQKVTQGTCTPTQYVVGYDESRMPQEDLIQFTYNQCYNYYNWQGTVKVPSMLQCADKLSKLAGQAIQDDFQAVKGSRISKSFYFL